ncbi:helix-turn-helix domain-containing protein [Nocardioides aestuarii]|uniref:ArsR/SmtB family transcription factor n=1 Tax=Nocardioides aestuarii TaxID=252231 RepID=A0ABW4TLE5_9ACTN
MKRHVHDPTVLRAIAHPVRNRILGELSAQGPLRAADLSAELGVPANQASFHLRQLAKYGLVEEAVGEGRDRRDRVWRLADETGLDLDITEMEKQPGGAAAAAVFRSQAAGWAHELVDTAYSESRRDGVHRSITDQTLRLTPEEARALTEELSDVLNAWVRRTRGRDPERLTYSYLAMLQPLPDQRAKTDDA